MRDSAKLLNPAPSRHSQAHLAEKLRATRPGFCLTGLQVPIELSIAEAKQRQSDHYVPNLHAHDRENRNENANPGHVHPRPTAPATIPI